MKALIMACVLAAVLLGLLCYLAYGQDAVEGWNPAWPIEGNTNVSIYTNWIAKDLWRAADERLRALGPASQESYDAYGFNFVYSMTGEVGRTAATWAVVWTNHGTATTAWVTNWFPVYGTVTVTNQFDALTAGGVTGSPDVRVEFLNQLDDAILTALAGYVMPYYDDIGVDGRYNDWFARTNGAGVWPTMFPLMSKVDLADKYGRAGGQHYAQAIGQTTNDYGQATNGVGVWVKRWNRPMFLPLAEWTCTGGSNWTERTFWQSTYKASLWGGSVTFNYNYGPAALTRLESRLFGNVGTPKWRWYAGKTNSTFSTITVEFGPDLAAVTVYDQTNKLYDLDTFYDTSYTETVSGTNQAASQAFVHWWNAPVVAGTGTNGDRLVLVWQAPQFTTWEDSEGWDADLFKEALDARWKFLDLMRYTVAEDWGWVDGLCVTNSLTITNVTETHYQTNITEDVWTNVFPPEDIIWWWVPTGNTPYVAGFWVDSADYYYSAGSATTDVGDAKAPVGRLTLAPNIYFFEGIAYLMTDPAGVANDPDVIEDFLANQVSNSVFGTTYYLLWDFAQQDKYSTLEVQGASTSSVIEVRDLWTGRQHRSHFYTRNDGSLGYNPTPPITNVATPRHRHEVGDWNYDATNRSSRITAEQDAANGEWYISGTTNTSDTGFYFEAYASNTMVKIRREVQAKQEDSRNYLLLNSVEGGPHLIEWNFVKQ